MFAKLKVRNIRSGQHRSGHKNVHTTVMDSHITGMHSKISELMYNAKDGAEIFGDKRSKALQPKMKE